ncbi:hypothetical protein BVI2075_250028 [Burkholderia vietnamiensis]|nr:hypothetical protein BVI2075_250028 [Burkholderia vietnamiensis]
MPCAPPRCNESGHAVFRGGNTLSRTGRVRKEWSTRSSSPRHRHRRAISASLTLHRSPGLKPIPSKDPKRFVGAFGETESAPAARVFQSIRLAPPRAAEQHFDTSAQFS